MNTKEAAKEWRVPRKEAIRFCEEGMVPTADRVDGDFDIPSGTLRPPCHRKPAVLMLENIEAIKTEDTNPWVRGFSYDDVISCYTYFLDCGFISGFITPYVNGQDIKVKRMALVKALRDCNVTKRGRDFINSEASTPQHRLKVNEVNVGGKVAAGPVEVHGDIKLEREVAL